MVNNKVIFGTIILIVAIYLLIFMDSPAARFLGGGILAVIGLGSILNGFMQKEKPNVPKTPPTETPPSETPPADNQPEQKQ